MKLYSYWRSSASYRVRIALNLKGLAYDVRPISLLDDEHHSAEYLRLNPQGLVPLLEDGEISIAQSPAILEYLEERYPAVTLLPDEPGPRSAVRQLMYTIACDIHPLCNLRVMQYLRGPLDADDAAAARWYAHWVSLGLAAVEAQLERRDATQVCVGRTPTLADVCLIPQVYNARRYEVPLDDFPRICQIDAYCNTLDAFQHASPDHQLQ